MCCSEKSYLNQHEVQLIIREREYCPVPTEPEANRGTTPAKAKLNFD